MKDREPEERPIGVRRSDEPGVDIPRELDGEFLCVLDSALAVCRADRAMLALVDSRSSALTVRWVRPAGVVVPPVLAPATGTGAVVLETRRPARCADVATAPRTTPTYAEWARSAGVVTEIVVPVDVHGRIDALLYAQRRSALPFTGADEAALLHAASYAALAIRYARLLTLEQRMHAATEAVERALRESEERYRLLLERNRAGVLVTRRDGSIVDCNDALAHLLGYESKADILAHTVRDFYVDLNDRAPLLSRVGPEGTVNLEEMRWRRRDGSIVWLRVNLRQTPDGLLDGIIVDITDTKRAAEAERHAAEFEAIATLAAAAAHEINNPLAVVVGQLGMMREGHVTEARIDAALAAGKRIQDIVNRMTKITRIEMYQYRSRNLPPMIDIRKSSEPERP